MFNFQKFDDLISFGSNLFFVFSHKTWLKPGIQQAFTGLIGGNHHQVVADGERFEFMGELESSQYAFLEQLMRFESGDVFTIQEDFTFRWLVKTGDDVE